MIKKETMTYSMKPDEKDALERLRAFWAGSSLGRTALNVLVLRPGRSVPEPASVRFGPQAEAAIKALSDV